MTPPTPAAGPTTGAWRALLTAVVIGVLLGVFSSFGDAARIQLVNGLANAIGPWVVVAFAAGAIAGLPVRGAILGTVALLAGMAVYYGRFLLDGNAFLLPFLAAWSAAAVATGGLLGAAGGAWRSRRDAWRTLAAGLVIGVLLAEAAYRLLIIETWTGIGWDRTYTWTAVGDLAMAVVLLLVLAPGRRLMTLATALPIAGLMLLGLFALDLF